MSKKSNIGANLKIHADMLQVRRLLAEGCILNEPANGSRFCDIVRPGLLYEVACVDAQHYGFFHTAIEIAESQGFSFGYVEVHLTEDGCCGRWAICAIDNEVALAARTTPEMAATELLTRLKLPSL